MAAPALPRQTLYLVTDEGEAEQTQQQTFPVAAQRRELPAMFLQRLCWMMGDDWHVGDRVSIKVRQGEIQGAHIVREPAAAALGRVSVSIALIAALEALVDHGFGEVVFRLDPNGVLLHELTEISVRILPGESRPALRRRIGARPGDLILWDEQAGTARITRTALPLACVAAVELGLELAA
jgi:hypothetical protein